MLAAVLMVVQAATAQPAADRYRLLTRADVPCEASADGADDIVVCGKREADGFRVPLIEAAESDRDRPLDYAARLLDGRTNVCGVTSRVFTDCGMVGVSAKVGFDGKVTRERPLAP